MSVSFKNNNILWCFNVLNEVFPIIFQISFISGLQWYLVVQDIYIFNDIWTIKTY